MINKIFLKLLALQLYLLFNEGNNFNSTVWISDLWMLSYIYSLNLYLVVHCGKLIFLVNLVALLQRHITKTIMLTKATPLFICAGKINWMPPVPGSLLGKGNRMMSKIDTLPLCLNLKVLQRRQISKYALRIKHCMVSKMISMFQLGLMGNMGSGSEIT